MKKKWMTMLIVGTMLLLSACGSKSSDELTIYSALPESEIPTYLEAFKEETGITVNYVRLSAGEITAKLQAEKNNPGASVWYGGPGDTFVDAITKDLIEPYKSPEVANMPAQYVNEEGYWSPIYVGALAFACDKDWFEKQGLEYPKSWEDLTKPEFKDQISMAHPGSSGTAYTVLSTIVQLKGEEAAWEYFTRFDENVRQYTKSGSAPPKNVALGEAAIGIAFSHDCLKPTAEGYPIELSFPEDGTGYEIGGIALIKNGPKGEQENAKKFIDWVLSKKGQDTYSTNNSFRMPVNKDATEPKGIVKISDLKVIEYDFIWSGVNKKRLVEDFTDKIANKDNLKK